MNNRYLLMMPLGIVTAWVALALGFSQSAHACSVCFGAAGADNPDAAGLNAGVAVLFIALAVIQILVGRLFLRLMRSARTDKEAES